MLKHIRALPYLCLCLFSVSACIDGNYSLLNPIDPDRNDYIDPNLKLNRDDYRNLNDLETLHKKGEEGAKNVMEPPIPDLAEILAAPKPPKLGETQLVSVAVTDDVPLKDVIIELSRLADVDVEVDANITGGISFRAKDRPFNEVIERIADLAGLRYSMKNNVLRIERDAPYIEVYALDFLNMERSSSSSISINTSVLSNTGASSGGGGGGGGGGGTGLNSGSDTSITATAQSDFWQQFDEGVKKILSYVPPTRVSSTTVAVQPTAPELPPSVPEEDIAIEDQGDVEGAPAAPVTTATQTVVTSNDAPFYIINRQASTLTVSATERQHALVKEFIRRIRANAFSQVIIEAKIVEVALNDEYQSGINWSQIGGSRLGLTANFDQTTVSGSGTPNVGTLSFTQNDVSAYNIDLNAVLKLVQTFGTTRTLSSPRLHAVNNQQAVLTFADNQVYYTLEVDQTSNPTDTGATSTTTTVSSTPHTIPIGIILSIQPTINVETNEVTLNIRPTLSRVTGFVSDPAVAFLIAQLADAGIDTEGLSSQVPIVQVREMDSILKVKSGQVMVIGGLMEDKDANVDQGLPGVSGIPWLGNLVKGVGKSHQLTELVIFVRATIVTPYGNADPADKGLYEKFTKDPRPLKF